MKKGFAIPILLIALALSGMAALASANWILPLIAAGVSALGLAIALLSGSRDDGPGAAETETEPVTELRAALEEAQA
ncbi:MAG: hypothetical protein ACOC8L_12170, partial [Spirochaetota bacterium]